MSFVAKWRGECIDCDDPILPGQRVEFDDDRNLRHIMCEDHSMLAPDGSGNRVPLPLCPRCFTEMSRTGVCGFCDG